MPYLRDGVIAFRVRIMAASSPWPHAECSDLATFRAQIHWTGCGFRPRVPHHQTGALRLPRRATFAQARMFDGARPMCPLSTTSRTEIAPMTGTLTHAGALRWRLAASLDSTCLDCIWLIDIAGGPDTIRTCDLRLRRAISRGCRGLRRFA